MKYLENLSLERITHAITNRVLAGGRILDGRIEAYSTKRAGDDKKQSKIIEQKLVSNAPLVVVVPPSTTTAAVPTSTTTPSCSSSSISPRADASPRFHVKLLIDMIQTLNASLVDYDFSSLTPESFVEIRTDLAVQQINSSLAELTIEQPMFLTEMWTAINDGITLSGCETFCLQDDPFADEENSAAWSFIYFFFNKELKRICLFACVSSNIHRRNSVFGAGDDDEDEIQAGDDNDEEEDGEGDDDGDDSEEELGDYYNQQEA